MKETERPIKERATGIGPQAATIEQRIGAPPNPCVPSMEQGAEPREDDQPTQSAPNMEKKHNQPKRQVTDQPGRVPMVACMKRRRQLRMLALTGTHKPRWTTHGIAKFVKHHGKRMHGEVKEQPNHHQARQQAKTVPYGTHNRRHET